LKNFFSFVLVSANI